MQGDKAERREVKLKGSLRPHCEAWHQAGESGFHQGRSGQQIKASEQGRKLPSRHGAVPVQPRGGVGGGVADLPIPKTLVSTP